MDGKLAVARARCRSHDWAAAPDSLTAVSAKSGNNASSPGSWLPPGATPRRRPAAKQSKPRKPAARRAAASGGRAQNSEWVPSRDTASVSEANGARAGKRSWRPKRPKGRIRSALERRRLIVQLRDAHKELDQERSRNAELTAELETLKTKKQKRAPARSRPKASR
jgi:hypothetical protein